MPDPKRPTKEEALPHTPPKPLTAEELAELDHDLGIGDYEYRRLRATIDHWKRRAEAAEERLRMHHPKEEIS